MSSHLSVSKLSADDVATIDASLAIEGFARTSEPRWQATQGFRTVDDMYNGAIEIASYRDAERPNLRWVAWQPEPTFRTLTHFSFEVSPMSTINDQVDEILADAEASAVPPVSRIVRFAKEAGRSLDETKLEAQLNVVMDSARTSQRLNRGWTIEFDVPTSHGRFMQRGDGRNGYVYTVDVRVECRPSKLRNTLAQEFDNIVATMDGKAQLPANRWKVAEVDGERYVPKEAGKVEVDTAEEIGYVPFEIPSDEEWLSAFDHLYGLDDYIEIIKSTLEAAVKTGWQNRVNIALIGPPACGKSDICKSLKKLLGEESVLEFDGTSTTMAGAQQNLAEREEMPRVLLVEEIEKAPEASLQWLLSVLDLRGEVRKTTARGNILKEVHMVGICTVNNQDVFDRLAAGALSSRFSLPLHFQRPPREILTRILQREIGKMPDGDTAWIEPTLDYAESVGLTDPRKLIAICLTGREKLLTGEYQRMLSRVAKHTPTYTVAGA